MSSYKRKATPGKTDWFVRDRFGMFIHFGLYSMPSRHEWIKTIEEIPEEKYDKYFKYFNPDLFDAREWARAAREAGMKYAVLTTKHHEGFCLFDSQYTDYKITNTPFGRDLVKEYVEAFRAEGLKIGLYYSLIDWHHPDYPIDVSHPLRMAENGAELDRGRSMARYAEYMRNQVRELLTNYGRIDVLWFDFSFGGDMCEYIFDFDKSARTANQPREWMQYGGGKLKEQWESEKLIAMIRELMPDIIINNRTGIPQDTVTPEQFQPREWVSDKNGEKLTWEVCQTFSGSWGYNRDEMSWKSPKMLIDMLIKTVSMGGNLIMNVGPTSRGCFDARAKAALGAYADWMRLHSRSIYGCTMAEPIFTAPRGTYLTQSEDGKRLYIHLIDYPFKSLSMDNIADKIDYAQFLTDGSEVLYSEKNGEIVFRLPSIAPHPITSVIEVFLK